MMKRLLKSLGLLAQGSSVDSLLQHCDALLGESGESIGVALAAQTLATYDRLDPAERKSFFLALLSRFSPDPKNVLAAAQRYAEDTSPRQLWALEQAAEPPRQELLRRLNRAPGGTAAILRMREHLIACARDVPDLEAVDFDFHHLLCSWFNPGFLRMEQVSWRTPAELLERIIEHERVHEIQGWDDLRRRLQADRRCFAFFHPMLPGEPLIFVEVALTQAMPDAIAPLLNASGAVEDPKSARVAVFYSISNCQPGLRGVSLGNFLIKRVVDSLTAEFPRLNCFCTLSPIPGFARWLQNRAPARAGNPADDDAKNELLQLCAEYFLHADKGGERTIDPVARFHLGNGARLERINWAANRSARGVRESLGLMVNYLYDPARIERNHELFIAGRNIAVTRGPLAACESDSQCLCSSGTRRMHHSHSIVAGGLEEMS